MLDPLLFRTQALGSKHAQDVGHLTPCSRTSLGNTGWEGVKEAAETHAHLDISLQALPPLLQSSGPPVGQAFGGKVGHFVQFLDLSGGYTVRSQHPY